MLMGFLDLSYFVNISFLFCKTGQLSLLQTFAVRPRKHFFCHNHFFDVYQIAKIKTDFCTFCANVSASYS